MGRWAPRNLAGTDRLTELQDDLDGFEEEPLEEYYQRQAAAAAAQLQHGDVTDPTIRARLERELAHWRRRLDTLTIEGHWNTGEGDRRLF